MADLFLDVPLEVALGRLPARPFDLEASDGGVSHRLLVNLERHV